MEGLQQQIFQNLYKMYLKKKYKNIKNLACLRKDIQKIRFKKNICNHAISRFGVMIFKYPLRVFALTN